MTNPPSNFPTSLDTDANLKTVIDRNLPSEAGDDVIALHHNIIKNCIKAIEGVIGITGSSDPDSLMFHINKTTDPHGASMVITAQLDVDQLSFGRVYTDSIDPKVDGGNVHIMPGQASGAIYIGFTGNAPTIIGPELRVPWISYATSALSLQAIGEHDVDLFVSQTTATQRYFSIYGHSSSSDSLYMYHDTSYAHINATTFLKLQSLGGGGVSLFEDQVTATQRYLYVYGPNSPEYLRFNNTGAHSHIYSSSGVLYLHTQGAIHLQAQATDTALMFRLFPKGTADTVTMQMRNSASLANYGQIQFGVDGAIAQLFSSTAASGTPVTSFRMARYGAMDISLFEDQTTATQRYLKVFQPNSADYIQIQHNASGGVITGSAVAMSISNYDFYIGDAVGSNFRTRESGSIWYLNPDAGEVQLASGSGSSLHLNSYGSGDVDLFLNQTTATQRALNIHAPNSPYFGYIYHNTYDIKIGNSYAGRRIDFESPVYVEGSLTVRGGELFRIYNLDNTSYVNIQCLVGTDSGVALFSSDDGGMDFNPNGPMMFQLTGRGNVSLFEEQITATQRYLQVFAPNSTDYIQMYHNDVSGFVNAAVGGLILSAQTLISLTTGANEWIYFSAGGTFRWQDVDAGNALRMTLDSATGLLTLITGTGVTEFSIDGTLGGNSDDALPTEKAVKTYVDAASGLTMSDNDPIKGDVTAYEGVGAAASRDDHVHPDLSRAPDYDSGWFALASGSTTKTHSLGTTELLIQVYGKDGTLGIMNMRVGGIGGGSGYRGGWYDYVTTTQITVNRESGDALWDDWRILIWKLI